MYLNQLLSISGLLIDIFGAFYLAQSFITKNTKDIFEENHSNWLSFPIPEKLLSEIKQKAEAEVGFYLLLTGFILQILSSLCSSYNIEISIINIMISVTIVMMIPILSYIFVQFRFCYLGKLMFQKCNKKFNSKEGEKYDYCKTITEQLKKEGCKIAM